MSNCTIPHITGSFLFSPASTVESRFYDSGCKGFPHLTLNFNDSQSIILVLNFHHRIWSSNPLLQKESLNLVVGVGKKWVLLEQLAASADNVTGTTGCIC
jgi:hypothetical protein